MMTDKYIKMFASCIPVKGKNQASICDVQRSGIQIIPNDLYNLLEDLERKKLSEIKEEYNNQYDEIIDEYVEFLIKNEFAFYTVTPSLFPDLNLYWHAPFTITNAIIDISKNSSYDIIDVFNQLEDFNCKHIQIRFFYHDQKFFLKLLIHLKKVKSIVHSIDLIIPFQEINLGSWKTIFNQYPRLNSIIFTNCTPQQKNKIKNLNQEKIIGTNNSFQSIKSCGVISKANFAVNIPTFTESQHHNSCLNRKLSIDVNGNIKNCPSMPESFGNIKDTTLEEALDKPGFKKYWNITKDQIEVCKDCEFRHVCTDCRAYTERTKFKDDIDLSKPLKCGYNPYTNEWAEWSTNPLKEKAIAYYGMEGLVKKKK